MAQAKFRVQFNGGEAIEVAATPLANVRAERRFKGDDEVSLVDGRLTIEAVYALAYEAARIAGKAGSDLDAWLADVADVEPIDADEDADPNGPAAA